MSLVARTRKCSSDDATDKGGFGDSSGLEMRIESGLRPSLPTRRIRVHPFPSYRLRVTPIGGRRKRKRVVVEGRVGVSSEYTMRTQ